MRNSFHHSKKISPTKHLPVNGLYKFVINQQYQVTLRINDASKFTYARLLALLSTQQIIKIIEGRPCIQSSILSIKSQKGAIASSERFDVSDFAINFPKDLPILFSQHPKRRPIFQIRPVSGKKKTLNKHQVDLKQLSISTYNNKIDDSINISPQKSFNRASFKLRTHQSQRKWTQMQAVQVHKRMITQADNQIEQQIPDLGSSKRYKRQVRPNSKLVYKKVNRREFL